MINKKEAIQASNTMWDSWLNSLNALCSLQEKIEKKPLQAFESQREWVYSVRDRLSQVENESKRMATDWKASVQQAVNSNQQELGEENIVKWPDQLEEIGHKTQTMIFSSSRNSLELISRSQAQLETAYQRAIDQQQQNRTEYVQLFEGWIDQVKQTQKDMLKSFSLAK